MEGKRYHYIVVAILFITIVSSGVVKAGIGQTAGELTFGDIPRGGEKTLTFGVINTDPTPMPVVAELLGNFSEVATVEPKRAVIPTGETLTIKVTVFMPRDAVVGAVYGGSVVARTDYQTAGAGAVGASLLLAVRKDGSAFAASEVKPAKFPFVLIVVVAIILIVALLVVKVGFLRRKQD